MVSISILNSKTIYTVQYINFIFCHFLMFRHKPVLLKQIIDVVPQWASTYFDWTLWHAWHTQELLSMFPDLHVVWVDKDMHMLDKASIFLGSEYADRFTLVHCPYDDFDKFITVSWIKWFDCMLLDIWVNMDHFKVAERWFSIKLEGDLDMRFDTSSWIPLKERLRKTNFDELVSLFTVYTDFWQKYREWIARDLIKYMKQHPFLSTKDVHVWAKSAWVNAKVLAILFQARRIVINDELWALERFLKVFHNYLLPSGRCCIITYHSWEDRLVKHSFKELVDKWVWLLYNKKVIKPNWKELERNKAARSAKLRIFEKT